MSGFLDPTAPSIEAEYGRYIDGDLLGKLIARNLLINRLGYAPQAVYIPVGRYGDATTKYALPGPVAQDPGDGHVDIDGRRTTFEIKCARLNIANRSAGKTAENWAFVNVRRSTGKAEKSYDVLIAIGVYVLGLEDSRYWEHRLATHDRLSKLGHPSNAGALPHESEYLSLCSFFFIPRTQLTTNFFRLTVGSVDQSAYSRFRAWGYDGPTCKQRWASALNVVTGSAQAPAG